MNYLIVKIEIREVKNMGKQYVLVSQGIEIFRTHDKLEAENIMNEQNSEYYDYCQKCFDNNECPADNEIFMYEED